MLGKMENVQEEEVVVRDRQQLDGARRFLMGRGRARGGYVRLSSQAVRNVFRLCLDTGF